MEQPLTDLPSEVGPGPGHHTNLSSHLAPGAILSPGDTAGTKADNLPGLLSSGRREADRGSHAKTGVRRECWAEDTAHAKAKF